MRSLESQGSQAGLVRKKKQKTKPNQLDFELGQQRHQLAGCDSLNQSPVMVFQHCFWTSVSFRPC